MKYIEKNPVPQELREWIETFQEANRGAFPKFSDFSNENRGKLKKAVKTILLTEQGALCCYCMQRIYQYNSHFEHFAPRHWHKDKEVDYNNLLLSCEGEWGDGSHCGREKDDEDTCMLVSPTDPNVEAYFQYGLDGEISSCTAEGMTSIRVMGLRNNGLNRHRLEALKAVGFFDNDFDEIRVAIREDCLHRSIAGEFMEFCQAVLYCIDNY